MEISTHRFPGRSRNGEPLLIMPVGDIQWYGEQSGIALGMLKRHILWGVEHGVWFIGMGDYIDAYSPSNRERLRSAALYDTARTVTDKGAKTLVDEIYEEALKPSRGRWLGLLEGHHFHELASGMTTDMILADKLQTKFLGTSTIQRLLFSRGRDSGANQVLVWAHHGAGGGTTSANVLNRLKRMALSFEADVFLMGHQPTTVNDRVDKLVTVFPDKGDPYLIHRTQVLTGTGGFMKSWVVGAKQGQIPRGGYGEQAMYQPACLGGVLIKIQPRWKVEAGHEVWLPDLRVEA